MNKKDIKNIVNKLPKHYWVEMSNGIIECSNCGLKYLFWEYDIGLEYQGFHFYKRYDGWVPIMDHMSVYNYTCEEIKMIFALD